MRVKLCIVADEGATPTHFGPFMSFGQVETYMDLPIALKSYDVLTSRFWGDKEENFPTRHIATHNG